MAQTITFKVETQTAKFGAKFAPNEDGTKSTMLAFKPDKTCKKTLDSGDYLIDWVFWGPDSTTFKLTLTDADGTVIAVFNDKMKAGKGFEHDIDHFEVG